MTGRGRLSGERRGGVEWLQRACLLMEAHDVETCSDAAKQCIDWLHGERDAQVASCRRIPLHLLEGWNQDRRSGNFTHESGKFFSVQGLAVRAGHDANEVKAWSQPIIVQPEYGVLGILLCRVGGEYHALLQAKLEPGNIHAVQISPTVQATQSNYRRVHGGRAVPYIEVFLRRRGRVLHDALQSEQASWFLRKRNRNIVIEVDHLLTPLPGFTWVPLRALREVLAIDHAVNMDTRTVLSGVSDTVARAHVEDDQPDQFHNSYALHSRSELLSWFTEAKVNARLDRDLVALSGIQDWQMINGAICHEEGKHFRVIGVEVSAPSREVPSWSQVMFQPATPGLVAMVAKIINGVWHLLVQARLETGAVDLVEIAPTVHCQPGNFSKGNGPRYLEEVLQRRGLRVRHESMQSEEGGRFYRAANRYVLLEAEDNFELDPPSNYTWMTLSQLLDFARLSSHVNVEARTLLMLAGLAFN